jgi:hypothetical protein
LLEKLESKERKRGRGREGDEGGREIGGGRAVRRGRVGNEK